jgi:hypothetical protein
MLLAAAFGVAALVRCGGDSVSPSSPSRSLAETLETPNFLYRFSSGDAVQPDRQQTFHEWALRELAIAPPRRITYNKYRDRSHMGDLVGVVSMR